MILQYFTCMLAGRFHQCRAPLPEYTHARVKWKAVQLDSTLHMQLLYPNETQLDFIISAVVRATASDSGTIRKPWVCWCHPFLVSVAGVDISPGQQPRLDERLDCK